MQMQSALGLKDKAGSGRAVQYNAGPQGKTAQDGTRHDKTTGKEKKCYGGEGANMGKEDREAGSGW